MFKIDSILSACPDHDVRGECMLQTPTNAHRLAACVAHIGGGTDKHIGSGDSFAVLFAVADEDHDSVALFYLVDVGLADCAVWCGA